MAEKPSTKICAKCHAEKPVCDFFKRSSAKDGLHPQCKLCCADYSKSRGEQNRASCKTYYWSDPERARSRVNKWRYDNIEISRASARARYHKNPEKGRALTRKWTQANLSHARAASVAWNKANPDKKKVHSNNRRAAHMSADGVYAADDVANIRKLQKDRCANPSCRVALHGRGSIDHIKPLSKGGSNWPRNLQLMCKSCNSSKHAKDQIDFMRENGFLL